MNVFNPQQAENANVNSGAPVVEPQGLEYGTEYTLSQPQVPPNVAPPYPQDEQLSENSVEQTPEYVQPKQPQPTFFPQGERMTNIPEFAEAKPNSYPAWQGQEYKSDTTAHQEELKIQSREGENVFVNPNFDPRNTNGQTNPSVTQQQVVNQMSGYPTSNALSSQPLSALIQSIVQSGDPHAATTWQAVIIQKIAVVLARLFSV